MKLLLPSIIMLLLLSCRGNSDNSKDALNGYLKEIERAKAEIQWDSTQMEFAKKMRSILLRTGYSFQETERIIDSEAVAIHNKLPQAQTDTHYHQWFLRHLERRKYFRDSVLPNEIKKFQP